MTHILEQEWLTTSDVSLLPRLGTLESRSDAKMKQWIMSSPMESVTGFDLATKMIEQKEVAIISRFLPREERLRCLSELDPDMMIVAIGLDEAEQILKGEGITTNLLSYALDIAHGDCVRAHDLTRKLRDHPRVRSIMSGSICTVQGAVRAADAGCTFIRVGVGPGSMCTTRIQTGVGAPNLSAVYRISQALRDHSMYPIVVADGGIKSPGDGVKYLAAGARYIMLGSELAKCKEAPGWDDSFFEMNQPPTKLYRGQASQSFQESMFGKSSYIEGASKKIYWEGHTVESIIQTYNNGLASAVSYLGLERVRDINPTNVEMIKITNNGYIEGTPHGL